MKNFAKSLLRFSGAVVLAFSLASAHATVLELTGEGGVTTNPTGSSNGPSQYVAQGFQFAATGSDGHWHENNPGVFLLHSNFTSTTINTWHLTAVGGGTFDFSSFTLVTDPGFDPAPLNWADDLGDSGTGVVGLNNINVLGVSEITFALVTGSDVVFLDQIVVNANSSNVPEPESLLLVLSSLGALGFVTRRRKQVEAK